MSILSKITGESFESIEARYNGKGYGEFKREVADVVASLLTEIQAKYAMYSNEKVLDEILMNGARKAHVVAKKTLNRTTRAMGLN